MQRARGRSSTAAATSCPQDVERLFVPVLAHRVVFTPSFVARARASGWAQAIEEFHQSCLAIAPRPGSEEDPLFDGPRSA